MQDLTAEVALLSALPSISGIPDLREINVQPYSLPGITYLQPCACNEDAYPHATLKHWDTAAAAARRIR